jgi:hypothetical protein
MHTPCPRTLLALLLAGDLLGCLPVPLPPQNGVLTPLPVGEGASTVYGQGSIKANVAASGKFEVSSCPGGALLTAPLYVRAAAKGCRPGPGHALGAPRKQRAPPARGAAP